MDTSTPLHRFIDYASDESATVARVGEPGVVPAAVAQYLQRESLPPRAIVATAEPWNELDWPAALERGSGTPTEDGETVITGAYAGIAEAGALVMLSGAGHPTELNFLAATHIVLLREVDLVESFEALWMRLRADYSGRAMPRTMNFVVGPSRTGDLGLPARLGAHGPSRLHIVLVGAAHP